LVSQPSHPLRKHLFTIQPTELWLEQPIEDSCVVSYEFPFEEEPIKSRNIRTWPDKHKYPLNMYGTHAFTIEEDPQDYLGDNALKFFATGSSFAYEGALHTDELMQR
jgi:hypothetical protein